MTEGTRQNHELQREGDDGHDPRDGPAVRGRPTFAAERRKQRAARSAGPSKSCRALPWGPACEAAAADKRENVLAMIWRADGSTAADDEQTQRQAGQRSHRTDARRHGCASTALFPPPPARAATSTSAAPTMSSEKALRQQSPRRARGALKPTQSQRGREQAGRRSDAAHDHVGLRRRPRIGIRSEIHA